MTAPIQPMLEPWHDFFVLLGTASATLIGLLFVAASVGSGLYQDANRPALRVFLSPTVVHFTCVLVASIVALVPLRSPAAFAALICADGVFGVAYAGVVMRRMVRHSLVRLVDLADRSCYAALPALAHATMTAAGLMFVRNAALGLELLAAGMAVLLLVGIRNAWDMTLWTVVRRSVADAEALARVRPQAEQPPGGP